MKKKSNHNTGKVSARPKTLTPYQTIKDLMAWKDVKMADTIIDHLCDFLLEWSLKEHSVSILSALREYGIPAYKYYEWKEKSEKLKEVHRSVKGYIGENLLKLGMYRRADPSFIHPRLPLYQPDFTKVDKEEKDFKRELATIKNDTAKNATYEIQFVERTVEDTKEVKDTIKRSKRKKDGNTR